MSATPRRTPRIAKAAAPTADAKLQARIDELTDQRTALIAAGEKMELALIQSRVNRHIINDWETVIHAIEEESK